MLTSAANEPGGTGSLGVLQDYLHRRMGVLAVRIERRRDEACMPWAQLRLPPFPQVAIRVLQLVSNENVQLHELGDLISSDAAFASEVLTIANSLLYAPRFPASSILQAIAVLGANHLQGLCLTVAVRAYLGRSLNHPMMRLLWRHSLACALIAEQLASTGFMDKDAAYTSGVLHDIGRFALAVVKPKEYAADWKLPCELEAVVSDHHCPRLLDGFWGMGELIKVSCRMADTAGFAAFPGCEVIAYPDLLEEIPERERRLFPSEVEALAHEVTDRIHAIESV